ncbi:MAG: hypothetical protein JWM86_1417 [Thermoleophilia bacterium]|nr:hypothetical protein [Thermoleophilia bacterium]
MTSPRSLLAFALLLLAATVLGAGCGGDDSDSSEAGDRDKPAKQATTPATSETDAGEDADAGPASDAGDGTAAKARVKAFVNAIESCAAQNTDGSYTGCTTIPAVVKYERSLQDVTDGAKITPGPDTMSYAVSVTTPAKTTFTEEHASDGTISKTCSPSGSEGCTGSW